MPGLPADNGKSAGVMDEIRYRRAEPAGVPSLALLPARGALNDIQGDPARAAKQCPRHPDSASDSAMHLAFFHRVGHLVFTGGVGTGNRDPEAEVGRRRAIAAGVPHGRIAVETRSTITYENLRNARVLMDPRAAPRVLIVSDPLHMRRAVTMARDLGLDAHPAPTPASRYRSWRSKAGFLSREVFFYSLYLLDRLFR